MMTIVGSWGFVFVHLVAGLSVSPAKLPHIDTSQKNVKTRRDFLGIIGCESASLSIASLATVTSLMLMPEAGKALTAEEAASLYDTYASTYNALDGGKAASVLGIEQARHDLVCQARGHVLEIGAGTGLNLDKYDPERVLSLTLLDSSEGMLQQAFNRFKLLAPAIRSIPVSFIKADATQDLLSLFGTTPLFDTALDSFSLCVMGNAGAIACLQQMGQVVKTEQQGGQVLLLENSRSSNPLLGLYQDATAEVAASAGGKGCLYNQNIRELIIASRRLKVVGETEYAAGLFRSFRCVRI